MASNSNPNPLFTKWLTEWRNGAKDVGSKMQFVYSKALKSLREHPNTLRTGQECKQLKGFGDKLCKKIEEKLSEINSESNEVLDTIEDNNEDLICVTNCDNTRNREITDFLKKKKKRPLKKTPNKTMSPLKKVAKTTSNREYIPSEGSGGYAILMALIKSEIEDSVDCLGKQELQSLAQEFSTTSITVPLIGSHYCGWNSIKTLINKNLIERNTQRYASYYLTQSGRVLAQKLYQIYVEKQTKNTNNEQILNPISNAIESDVETSDSETIQTNCQTIERQTQMSSQSSSSNLLTERFCLAANSFDIILCIDTREQASGVNKDMRKTALMSALQQNGVKVEMRTLSVGDFAWIAKHRITLGSNISSLPIRTHRELLMDFVIERKRIDDLAHSLKDRRWDEQKYRLINSGVRKPSYIIEYFGSHNRGGEFGGITCDTLDQAITNAEIDGFSIKRCDSYDDTIRYLTLMTRYLESYFKDKDLYSCLREELINKEVPNNHFMSFSEFGRNANKITNFTVSEMFLKHLLQVRGISVSKAKVIIEHYPTLQSLLDAFSIVDDIKGKQNLLSSLKCGLMGRNLGPNLSKKIYNHYIK